MKTLRPAWLDWPETKTLIAAFAKNAELRFVGGAVRDALLGRSVKEVDAASPLPPEKTMALLKAAGIKAVPTGIAHGTVTAVIDKKHFEITTLRRDVETFGRHAKVEYTGDWKADAARRDFTMNALYLSPEGDLFDYFGGVEDAKSGNVRFIGDAKARVAEDYLRILRFFRFHAGYGKAAPDTASLAACAEAAPQIATLSGERIQMEMIKLLSISDPIPTLALMQKHNIAPQIFGGNIDADILAPVKKLEAEINSPPLPLVRLAALLEGDAQRIALASERWRLSNQDTMRLRELQKIMSPDIPLSEQKKQLYENGKELFIQRAIASAARHDASSFAAIIHLPEQWQPPVFPVTGDDLKALGLKEGKPLGDMLHRLKEAWHAGDYALTKEELLARASK